MSDTTPTIRDLPRAEWESLRVECFERDDYACQWCGSTEELQADHVRPISEWPELALDLDNLQTLCGPCNRAKSDSEGDAVMRQPWLNPAYPELAGLVFSGSRHAARPLVPVTHTDAPDNPEVIL